MKGLAIVGLGAALTAGCASTGMMDAAERDVVERSKALVPSPPWPAGDERGMANAIGAGTFMRCAHFLAQPGAKAYELSHVRSNTMPMSPFSGPYQYKFNPTSVIPGTVHAFNTEAMTAGEPQAQGTQMDALGHFAYLASPWDGKRPNPAGGALYYGGYTQSQVKPTPDSFLQRLGMEKAPPVVTSAVLLDAKSGLGMGQPLKAGVAITAKDIEAMLQAQGLGWRGILPGDVLYVYTGWGDFWRDPDTEKSYYTKAPGLSYDAAKYLADRRVVAVGLDTPFVDPVNEGQLQGKAAPPAGTPPGTPFAVHHHLLTQAGIHHIESANLGELARDKVWSSCTMILPLRERGSAGSPIRPVAIGVPVR
jgi:kynurenine formamidase